MWYIASTCLFSRSCLLQIQRMVRNFIWIGRSNNDARAKVAWSTLTTQFSDGGLGLVDPDSQCKAFLAKFVVRAMLPGQGIWSNFLLNRLFDMKPSMGGSWKPSLMLPGPLGEHLRVSGSRNVVREGLVHGSVVK